MKGRAPGCIAGRRRGFLFTMPLMLGMGIIIFASMIAISQLFVTIGGPMVPDLLADMPTIFHYTEDGHRIPQYVPVFTSGESIIVAGDDPETAITEEEFAELFPSLAMYGLMVKIALGIFVILLMLAGLSYFFEEFNIVKQGTAYGIVAKMIVLVPIFLVLPYLWDMVALVIESSALYLMDPFGGDPHGRTTELWCMMGSVACSIGGETSVDPLSIFDNVDSFDRDSALSQDSWNSALQSPFFGEDFVVNVLLALFKGFSVMFMTAMMFVLSALRVMLTEVIIVSFPLVAAIGLIPWINTAKIADMFQQNLIGLSMAPIMSAVVLSVGLSTIDSQNMPPLRMWFQLLSVGFLAVFFPVMLSPMLGNLSTKVGNMVSSSITSASVAGSAGLKGMAQGFSQVSGGMKPNMGVGGARGTAGLAGGGQQQGSGVPSAQVGTATSGANLAGQISAMDKIKMYGMAGAIGALSGLGSGMVQSTTQAMGMGGAAAGVSNGIMADGQGRIDRLVQNSSTDNVVRIAANSMIGIEGASMAPTVPDIHNSTMLNPGADLGSMTDNGESFDAGRQLLNDPAARKEFINTYGQKAGISEMGPDAQARFSRQIADQISAHPNAAGRMFMDMKSDVQEAG